MKKYFLILISIVFFKEVKAQKEYKFWNDEMIKIATPTSNEDWINIKTDVKINVGSFFENNKQALGLTNDDEMKQYKKEEDNLGFTHIWYQQCGIYFTFKSWKFGFCKWEIS
jgi:hypothetical protein